MAVTNEGKASFARRKLLAAVIDRDRFVEQFGQIAQSFASEVVRKIRPNIGMGIGRMLAQMIFVRKRYEDIIGKLYIGVDEENDCSLAVVDQEDDAIMEMEIVLLTRLSSPGILRPVNTAARFIEWRIRDLTQDGHSTHFFGDNWFTEGELEGEIALGADRLRYNLFDCIDQIVRRAPTSIGGEVRAHLPTQIGGQVFV